MGIFHRERPFRIIALSLSLVLLTVSGTAFASSKEVLRVYNATEYIDHSTIADFEKEFNVDVVYEEFESNEDMYDAIVRDPKAYDVLVPSDYMIDRLIKEGRVAKIEPQAIPNLRHIAPDYLNPTYDPGNEYVVPYMVGTLGILYNKSMVYEPIDSWKALWNPMYQGEILMWDSMRDVIGASCKMLGFGINTGDDAELVQVKAQLLAQRSLVKAYGGDETRDMMVAGEGTLALVYSGDAKTAIDENPRLAYVIPSEGSNKWVDGFVIVKDTQHMTAAQNFINFMCRPNIAVRNMTSTGYTAPIPGAWSEFGGNKIMFPSAEELERCEAFLYDAFSTQKYIDIWRDIA